MLFPFQKCRPHVLDKSWTWLINNFFLPHIFDLFPNLHQRRKASGTFHLHTINPFCGSSDPESWRNWKLPLPTLKFRRSKRPITQWWSLEHKKWEISILIRTLCVLDWGTHTLRFFETVYPSPISVNREHVCNFIFHAYVQHFRWSRFQKVELSRFLMRCGGKHIVITNYFSATY